MACRRSSAGSRSRRARGSCGATSASTTGSSTFDRDDDRQRLTPAVLEMLRDPAAARARVAKAQRVVRRRQTESMAVVRRAADKARA
jgi:hypothetical protein